MAQRRMFSKSITENDAFLDMPLSTQALYFHLGMQADDDGFVSPNRVVRMLGAQTDDLKLLIAKKFVLAFESGVVVIKHWKINNYLQNDRKKETTYQQELAMLTVKPNNGYKMYTSCIQNVHLGKYSIGKDRLVEDRKERGESRRFTPPSLQEVSEYCNSRNNNIDAQQWMDFYSAKGWMVGKNKMKDWKASVRTWEKRNKTNSPRYEEITTI